MARTGINRKSVEESSAVSPHCAKHGSDHLVYSKSVVTLGQGSLKYPLAQGYIAHNSSDEAVVTQSQQGRPGKIIPSTAEFTDFTIDGGSMADFVNVLKRQLGPSVPCPNDIHEATYASRYNGMQTYGQ